VNHVRNSSRNSVQDLYDEFGNLKSTATPTSDPTTNTTKWSINDELKTGGLAALFASLSGGLGVSYMALSPSRIAFDSGATSNLASVTSLIISVVTLVVGSSMVSFLPPFYVGGLLFYAGIGYLLDGVLDGIQFYTKPEYLVIWIIAITSIFFGSFAAIGIGIVLASLLFIARYSHSPFVRLIKQIKPNSDSPMAAKVVHQHNEDIGTYNCQFKHFFC
jgi:MFS superfamily sulfate permease-like transporter